MRYGSAHHILWLLPLFFQGWWLRRFVGWSLVRRYPIVVSYLAVEFLWRIAGLALQGADWRVAGWSAFALFWVVTRPIIWALFFLVILELYSRMLEEYEGVRRLGQLVMYGALGSIAAVVATVVYLEPLAVADQRSMVAVLVAQEQSVYMATAAFVFALFLFKKFFRLAVARNVQVVFFTFGVYFAGMAALLVVRSFVGPEFAQVLNFSGVALYIFCIAAGALRFSTRGELEAPEPRMDPVEYGPSVESARRQLESFNGQLVRVLNAQ